jgi:serine/threonine protein kinase
MAALRLLAAALQFLLAAQAAWGSVTLFYVLAVLNLIVTPFLIWGGIAALKGSRSDVLAFSAVTVGLMEIAGLILAVANGGQTSRGAIALIVAGVIYRNMRSAEAKQYFAGGSGAGMQQPRESAETPTAPPTPPTDLTVQRGPGTPPPQMPPAPEPAWPHLPPVAHRQDPPIPVRTGEQRHTSGGQVFGRYRLIELVGRGGMGEVWRTYDTVTERVVALKVLPTQYADDPVFQERFRREARAAAALDEPHVVPIYDYGEIDGRLFVSMRLIKGHDLESILSSGAIPTERAVRIIDQIASALHAAHQVHLIHRDVKPSNILVTDEDFAYLIDFGIVRAAEQTGLTSASAVIGTWAYMAPERMTTAQCDARADIYALACVLYECLTSRQPFPGDSLESQIGGHLTLPPPRASEQHPEVPAQLDAVIATGMAKNPDDRYATARELARAASSALTGATTGPNPLGPPMTPPLSNSYPNPGPDPRLAFGNLDNHPVQWQGGPSPSDPIQQSPAPHAPGGAPAPRGRFLALATVGALIVVLAVVIPLVIQHASGNGGSRGSTAAPTSSAPRNTGPFTGTFTAKVGPKLKADGTPSNAADGAAYSESWRLRSACTGTSCVATAATGGQYPAKDLVFDKVGGRWLAVSIARTNCKERDNDEAWNVISVQPQPDGTMTGEFTLTTTNGCFSKRAVTFTRTANTDVSLLPDPATQAPRVASPAEALHGSYDEVLTNTGGSTTGHVGVRTDCLRTGERCMSYLLEPSKRGEPFVFGNGTWTLNVEYDGTCPSGGAVHIKRTITIPLPQPSQDPIASLSGHGYDNEVTPGTRCKSQGFDAKYSRTGD